MIIITQLIIITTIRITIIMIIPYPLAGADLRRLAERLPLESHVIYIYIYTYDYIVM